MVITLFGRVVNRLDLPDSFYEFHYCGPATRGRIPPGAAACQINHPTNKNCCHGRKKGLPNKCRTRYAFRTPQQRVRRWPLHFLGSPIPICSRHRKLLERIFYACCTYWRIYRSLCVPAHFMQQAVKISVLFPLMRAHIWRHFCLSHEVSGE